MCICKIKLWPRNGVVYRAGLVTILFEKKLVQRYCPFWIAKIQITYCF